MFCPQYQVKEYYLKTFNILYHAISFIILKFSYLLCLQNLYRAPLTEGHGIILGGRIGDVRSVM